jgi:hypothetical protein
VPRNGTRYFYNSKIINNQNNITKKMNGKLYSNQKNVENQGFLGILDFIRKNTLVISESKIVKNISIFSNKKITRPLLKNVP